MVIQQLRDAVVALRTLLERTRSRRDWLRTTCPRLAAGYAVWLAATLGLAIASTQQRLSPQDYPNWHLALPVGVLSCALGIATLELFFRHHRSTLHWLIEETENDIDSRLACHLRGDRTDRR